MGYTPLKLKAGDFRKSESGIFRDEFYSHTVGFHLSGIFQVSLSLAFFNAFLYAFLKSLIVISFGK